MFESLTDGVGGLGRWVFGRGATAIATATASSFLRNNQPGLIDNIFPAVGLALSMPLTVYLSTMDRRDTERKIVDRYRNEIGAALGIPAQKVTIEHVRLTATGNDALNMPANRVIEEALTRNDRHRTIAITSNFLSAATTIAAVVGVSMTLASAGATPLPWVATWLGSMAVSFGLDVTIKHLGNELFGYEGPSLHERISAIGHGLKRGRGVSQEQLMNLIVDANPQIEKDVEHRYGVAYEALPKEIKRDVIAKYEPAFEIASTTYALNHGLLPIGELAFTIEGVRSGAYAPVGQIVTRYRTTMPPSQDEKPFYQNVPGYERVHQFTEKLKQTRPARTATGFVGRLGHESSGELSRA